MIPTSRPAGSPAPKTALRMGAMLLCVYAALHLAAAGIVTLITGRDAATVVAPHAPAAIAAGGQSREGASAAKLSGPPGNVTASTGHAPACKPNPPTDSRCIYD